MENIDLVFDTIKSPIKSTSEYIGITDIDNNFTTDGPYMAASIYKVLSDEKSKLEQDFKNLAHDESNIKMLDSQRSNVTKKILKPYMVSKLITSIFNK